MIFNTALTILALAAPALAGGISSAAPSSGIKVGCMTDKDCSWGKSCVHNICVAAPASSLPPPPPPSGSVSKHYKSTVTKHTTVTSTTTTCSNGACSTICPIYTCWGDSCEICTECEEHKAEPTLTVTVVECSSCEGGYTTSTCYPDVTVTVTACNTCLTSSECTTPAVSPTSTCTTSIAPVPVYPSSTICTTASPVVSPTMPVWYSGANRAHVAYGGLVGIVAVAAFML